MLNEFNKELSFAHVAAQNANAESPLSITSLWTYNAKKMELIKNYDIRVLCNPGVESAQLLTPDNSRSGKVSVTKVSVMPGAEQPRHKHYTSEQVWVAIQGRGVLLLADDKEVPFEAGDVVRFSEKEIHGLKNLGSEIFEYISISTPPINFGYAYMHER